MKGALVILIALAIVGVMAWLIDKFLFNKFFVSKGDSDKEEAKEECCGMHINCPQDTLSPVTDEIEYYEDEDLDRFQGRTADQYTPREIEEFQDVLLTLRPEEVSGWARSIQLRKIELPTSVRDALLMIVAEQREAKPKKIKNKR